MRYAPLTSDRTQLKIMPRWTSDQPMETPLVKSEQQLPRFLYCCITIAKISDWLIFKKKYSYKEVHLDMTSNQVLFDVRVSVTYYIRLI